MVRYYRVPLLRNLSLAKLPIFRQLYKIKTSNHKETQKYMYTNIKQLTVKNKEESASDVSMTEIKQKLFQLISLI